MKSNNHLETLSRFVSQLSERKWDVTVTEATTGKTVYESHTKGASHEINAAEWASGIYVIKASIGNQILTQKIEDHRDRSLISW